MNIEDQLDYDDSLLQFYTSCQQYGARKVLLDFRSAFPDMFNELLIQTERLKPGRQVAILLQKPRDADPM